MNPRHLLCLALFVASAPVVRASAPAWSAVEPVLEEKCYSCHGGKDTKGEVNLKVLAGDPKVAENFEVWQRVLDTIDSGEMPPRKAKKLEAAEKTAVTAWVHHELEIMAGQSAGDPGPVTMRRLTNAEYDRSLRDLTGHDYRLAREFQADGGGGEGFANTGDVLFLNPSNLDKYIGAARQAADHATILPGTGIAFHEHRVGLRGYEQVKAQVEQGLYVWYQQKSTPHLPADFSDMREGDYMLACWKHRHFKTPLDALAKEAGLQLPFLENWWNLLDKPEPASRFLDLVRAPWRELPGPDAAAPAGSLRRDRPHRANPGRPAFLEQPQAPRQRHSAPATGFRRHPPLSHERDGQGQGSRAPVLRRLGRR